MKSWLGLLFVSLLWVSAQAAGAYTVIKKEGDIYFKPKNSLKRELVKQDGKIPEGSRVKMKEGQLLILQSPMKDTVTFKGKSYFQLTELSPAKKGAKTNLLIEMYQGKVKNKVKKLTKNSTFRIKTPVAVVGVRGTEFIIRVTEDGETDVLVQEGEVGVQDVDGEGDVKSVPAGSAAKIKADGSVKVKAVAGIKKAGGGKKAARKGSKKSGGKKAAGAKKAAGGETKEGGATQSKAADGDKSESSESSEGEAESDDEGAEEEGGESDEEGLDSDEDFDEESFEEDFEEEFDEDFTEDIAGEIADEVQETVQDELQQVIDELEAEILEELEEELENLDLQFEIENIE